MVGLVSLNIYLHLSSQPVADGAMVELPNPDSESVLRFSAQLSGLTTKDWLTIESRAGATVEEGAARAHALVCGAALNITNQEREQRYGLIAVAHDRVAEATKSVPTTVRHNGQEVPLRGRATTLSTHVVNALMSGDKLALRAVLSPFEGFIPLSTAR